MVTRREFFTVTMGTRTSALLATKAEADGGRRHEGSYQHPDIKILSKDQNSLGTRDGGLRVMTDLLTAFPKIDAVFAINDPAAIRSDLAARQAQRKDLFVVGVDGSPDAVNALKEPGSLFAATAAQDPFAMAQKATQIGYEIMNGKPPESKTILIPVTLVTREDVSKFQGWTK
jgi:ribose transport system substrate-binding protein